METHYQENSHSVEGGEEHHEKKTVMNKVKDKARRMKNTFNKMAHGHNANDDHKHEHDNDATSEEEEVYEEVEEEREADTEVRGAPTYESEAAGHFAGERGEDLVPGKEVNFGEAVATVAVDQGPSRPKENRLGTTAASDESQLLYPSTATGGDEVGECPLLSSFQAMAVSDKPKGAEDVFESPVSDKPQGVLESPPTVTHDHLSPDKPQQEYTPKEGTEEQKSSSYTEKISSAATTAKDAAVSAVTGSAEYGKMIASTLYGKVSGSGTTIMGKGLSQEEKNDDIKTGQPGQPEKENEVSVAV